MPASRANAEESLEDALAKLTPEQTEMFMRALSLTLRKRKFMLYGNLFALLLILGGFLWALFSFNNGGPGYVFMLPFAGGGFSLWLFGRLARQAGLRSHDVLTTDLKSEPAIGDSQ